MDNFEPSREQIERFLKSQGHYKPAMIGDEECWRLYEVNEGEFTHIIHEVDQSTPFLYSTKFYVNEKTCLKRSLNPYTHECEYEDMSKKWQEILSE